jgi:adenylosuccinate synthase
MWGDEGKGKVVDLLCPGFDVVVRYNGGANAGHTVCVGSDKFALHLLPTGVLHQNVTGVIGPGVVVDPVTLLEEIDRLTERGMDVTSRLRISERAHLVMAYHKLEDQLGERAADDNSRIGTTSRGIGPCYADKMYRTSAVRFGDLLYDNEILQRVRELAARRQKSLAACYADAATLDVEAVVNDVRNAKERLTSNICDTSALLQDKLEEGGSVLFEGANGMLLDVDHGTYPFVTSSSTGPHGIWPGAGVPVSHVKTYIGTTKAYSTRVGSGPFVTELDNDIGDRIRQRGHEFGTTTGRPRRCGWFDAVSCRYTAQLSGATDIALMHLDTLSGFDQVGLCVAYRVGGETLTRPPSHVNRLEKTEPIIELVPGWSEELGSIRRFEQLPPNAVAYVERIEMLIGVPVTLIGVGPDRSQTLVRGGLAEQITVPQPSSP